MKKLFCLFLILFSAASYGLPFSVVTKAGTQLPTTLYVGYTANAYYTVSNNTGSQRNNNSVKFLPPNVTQVTSGGTYDDTCGTTFNLAANGGSCTLQLAVSGAINGNDPNPQNHLFVCFPGGTTCAGTNNPLNVSVIPNPSLTLATNWINSLSASGYTAAQGNVFLMQNTDCALFISIFNSCFDQNPAAPYIVPQPPIENSYVDPYYAVPLEASGPGGVPTDIIYRLGDQDALVTIVSYPPKLAYLGYQSYVFSSESSNYPTVYPLQILSPDAARYELFASIGNDVNSVIVQNQFGTPWGGSVIMYITTSNQTLANALISNATAAGINANSIFVEPVGTNVITGNAAAAADLVTLIRYAVPESASAANTWLNALSTNVLVYKVTKSDISVSRYATPQYTARIGTTDETALQTAVDDVSALLQTYLAAAQGEAASVEPTVPTSGDDPTTKIPSVGFVGSVCLTKGTICNGDNQDTSTYAMLRLDLLGATETAFIVGVNHNVAGNTYYISDDISNAAQSAGVASSSQTNPDAIGFDNGVLTGSAEAVLDALGISVSTPLRALLPSLYITFISRNCANSGMSAASTYCITLAGTTLVPANDPISITERSYIRPTTTTGGNVNIMVYPSIVAATQDF